ALSVFSPASSLLPGRHLPQDEIGAAEIAILIQILLQITYLVIPGGLGVIVGKKSLQTKLSVSPIPHDVVILFEDVAVPFPKGLSIPGVIVIGQQFVCFSLNMDDIHAIQPRCFCLFLSSMVQYPGNKIQSSERIELLKLGPFWPNPPILSTSAPAYAFPAGARYG